MKRLCHLRHKLLTLWQQNVVDNIKVRIWPGPNKDTRIKCKESLEKWCWNIEPQRYVKIRWYVKWVSPCINNCLDWGLLKPLCLFLYCVGALTLKGPIQLERSSIKPTGRQGLEVLVISDMNLNVQVSVWKYFCFSSYSKTRKLMFKTQGWNQ